MATKLTPAQLAALDFLIAVGQESPPGAVIEKPVASAMPLAIETPAAADPAAAPTPPEEVRQINIGGGGTLAGGGGGTRGVGFLDDVVSFFEDAYGDLEDDFEWADAVSAVEDLAEHLAEALNGLPIPLLQELGVRDQNGTVVDKSAFAEMRKRPLSVNDLIALRDAQRKL